MRDPVLIYSATITEQNTTGSILSLRAHDAIRFADSRYARGSRLHDWPSTCRTRVRLTALSTGLNIPPGIELLSPEASECEYKDLICHAIQIRPGAMLWIS